MRSSARSFCTFLAAGVASTLMATAAHAQIKEPGAHPKYLLELEPHFLVQWTYTDWHDSDGIGLGGRVSIPVIDNGPIPGINNSLAVGVGFDWAHFDVNCYGDFHVPTPNGYSCTANHLWVPVVAQWNFWFTPVVSVFVEVGAALHHANADVGCPPIGGFYCGNQSYTRAAPVVLVGPRFTLSNRFAIAVRLGIPYLSIGGSFYL